MTGASPSAFALNAQIPKASVAGLSQSGTSQSGAINATVATNATVSTKASIDVIPASSSVTQLPKASGAAAKALLDSFCELHPLARARADSPDAALLEFELDNSSRHRQAITQYLLTQHAQRREDIRAMVGVDLYA